MLSDQDVQQIQQILDRVQRALEVDCIHLLFQATCDPNSNQNIKEACQVLSDLHEEFHEDLSTVQLMLLGLHKKPSAVKNSSCKIKAKNLLSEYLGKAFLGDGTDN